MMKDKMLWLKDAGGGHRIYTEIVVLCSQALSLILLKVEHIWNDVELLTVI